MPHTQLPIHGPWPSSQPFPYVGVQEGLKVLPIKKLEVTGAVHTGVGFGKVLVTFVHRDS